MEDISREDLVKELNRDAYHVGRIGGAWLLARAFVYTRYDAATGDILVLAKQGDTVTEILRVAIPPDALRYATVRDVVQAKARALADWSRIKGTWGHRYRHSDKGPYPTAPDTEGVRFYVLRRRSDGAFLTYPGSTAVRTFPVRPEAEARRCAEPQAWAWDEVAVTDPAALLEYDGRWYRQKEASR